MRGELGKSWSKTSRVNVGRTLARGSEMIVAAVYRRRSRPIVNWSIIDGEWFRRLARHKSGAPNCLVDYCVVEPFVMLMHGAGL